jgi:hypothetical protein
MSNTVKLWTPKANIPRVRNAAGNPILCCNGFDQCDQLADARVKIEIPHESPRWTDPATGKQEMLVYTFCSDKCRRSYARRVPALLRYL